MWCYVRMGRVLDGENVRRDNQLFVMCVCVCVCVFVCVFMCPGDSVIVLRLRRSSVFSQYLSFFCSHLATSLVLLLNFASFLTKPAMPYPAQLRFLPFHYPSW